MRLDKKINNLDLIPKNAILVTADVVGLCPSIPHEVGLRALREANLDQIFPTIRLISMSDLKTKFIEGQYLQTSVWLRYVDDIFSSGSIVKRILRNFQKNLTILTNS